MATFPAVGPSARTYTFGAFPVTEERGLGGGSVRFLHGRESYEHDMTLEFEAISESNAKLIRDHYRGQQGGSDAFQLSAEVWGGHTSLEDIAPGYVWWRYAAPIEETHRTDGRYDISIELQTTSIFVGAYITGLGESVFVELVGGTASTS